MSLVIFTEEPSMKALLECLLPKIGCDRSRARIIAFDGVGNLERALPAQLRAVARTPGTKVLILRDRDGEDCHALKARFAQMAQSAGIERFKARIVCQMLEAWFIGDTGALQASGHFRDTSIPRRLQSCDPDELSNPKRELRRLRDGYNEITGARAIGPHLTVNANRSKSFQHTIAALRALCTQ